MNKNIIEIKNVSKKFPGVLALNDVSFCVREGDIHALVGENGAGKSTLIKIISGVYIHDSGIIEFNGTELKDANPIDCIKMGISTVHQELRMVDSLSVAENIFLGTPIERKTAFGNYIDWEKLYEESQKLIVPMGINIDPRIKISELSVAKKQIVEICKAVRRDAKLIIMDEPSATLTENELDVLFRIIGDLKKRGITVIYISHRLEEIFKIADRVTIMRDGKHIITDDVKNVTRKTMISHMVGREIEDIYPKRNEPSGKVLFEAIGIERKGVLHNINFVLHEGEILAIAGLVGSGRTELARALFGVDKITQGEIKIKGETKQFKSNRDAIRNRIALMPEDRKAQGIVSEMGVGSNITLVGIDKIIKLSFLDPKLEQEYSKEYIQLLKIQTPSWNHTIKNLSGGNQQKCVLAKWLFVDSDILIFDEPTRGIDVGAKQEIYRLLNQLASQGKGIIMISSELPEVMGMAHRILVMHDGKFTGELIPERTNQEEIMHYATI
jgi:ABC-type sugar transport system ATPase subunit